MANIIVLGAGLAGMSAAYELRDTLGAPHRITVIGDGDRFSFTPPNVLGWMTLSGEGEPATLPLVAAWIQRMTTLFDTQMEVSMNIDRAVMAFAGLVILASVALTQLVSPWWWLLTAFVGLNLLQASFTGFCPVALLFRRLGLGSGCAFR